MSLLIFREITSLSNLIVEKCKNVCFTSEWPGLRTRTALKMVEIISGGWPEALSSTKQFLIKSTFLFKWAVSKCVTLHKLLQCDQLVYIAELLFRQLSLYSLQINQGNDSMLQFKLNLPHFRRYFSHGQWKSRASNLVRRSFDSGLFCVACDLHQNCHLVSESEPSHLTHALLCK